MNKKNYIAPKSNVIVCQPCLQLLYVSGDGGIGYGGVDTSGDKVPSSRFCDFDEDEDY